MTSNLQKNNEPVSLSGLAYQECLVVCKPDQLQKMPVLPTCWQVAPLEFLFLVHFAASPACLDASMSLKTALAPIIEAARATKKTILLVDDSLSKRKSELDGLDVPLVLLSKTDLQHVCAGADYPMAS